MDQARFIKLFGERTGAKDHRRKYSPAESSAIKKEPEFGRPDAAHISTSHVERQNLSMRMQMCRLPRLTDTFSKRVENHAYALALHFVHYNCVRIRKTPRVAPAMAAGVTDRLWGLRDIPTLVETAKAAAWPKKRGSYKPRAP